MQFPNRTLLRFIAGYFGGNRPGQLPRRGKGANGVQLEDADAELEPVPTDSIAYTREPELEHLTSLIHDFNDHFGNIDWKDADNVRRQIALIPAMVSKDKTYQNAMRNADKQEARTESDRVLQAVIMSIMADNMELFKQFNDNPAFKKRLSDMVFTMTCNTEGKPFENGSPM